MDDEPEEGDANDRKGLPEPDPSRDPSGGPGTEAGPDADLPADVESTLTQLLAAARTALREGRPEEARSAVDTARTVARNKLAAGDRRDRLVHGCDRVVDLATADPAVAAEYLDAVRRRLP